MADMNVQNCDCKLVLALAKAMLEMELDDEGRQEVQKIIDSWDIPEHSYDGPLVLAKILLRRELSHEARKELQEAVDMHVENERIRRLEFDVTSRTC